MIYYIFIITFFFATWLNAKFIRDASGKDGYWHITQFYGWVWTYLAFGLIPIIYGMPLLTWVFKAGFPLVSFGLMYPLMYNSLLNLMRKLEWTHLGRYDLPLWLTRVLFVIGFIIFIFTLTKF